MDWSDFLEDFLRALAFFSALVGAVVIVCLLASVWWVYGLVAGVVGLSAFVAFMVQH